MKFGRAKPGKRTKHARDPVSQLSNLRGLYRAESKGHKQKVLQFICSAFAQFLLLNKSGAKRLAFYDVAKVPGPKRKLENLATEVMAFLAGARTVSQRQQAWKRARAVGYLHDAGISTADLAKEIAKRGGIDKVVSEAAKKAPLKPKPANKKLGANPKKGVALKPARQGDDLEADSIPAQTNDQLVLLLFSMRLSLQDQLRELKVGEKVQLIARRLPVSNDERSLMKVVRIVN